MKFPASRKNHFAVSVVDSHEKVNIYMKTLAAKTKDRTHWLVRLVLPLAALDMSGHQSAALEAQAQLFRSKAGIYVEAPEAGMMDRRRLSALFARGGDTAESQSFVPGVEAQRPHALGKGDLDSCPWSWMKVDLLGARFLSCC